jgi:hypothetical protein
MKSRTVVVLVGIAALLLGCAGDGAGPSDEAQIRSVSAAYNSALLALFEGAPVYERLCSLSTKETKAAAGPALRRLDKSGGCTELFKVLQQSLRKAEFGSKRTRRRARLLKRRMRHYRINSIRIKADTAVVTSNTSYVHGEGGPTFLKKEDGKWLIAGDRN